MPVKSMQATTSNDGGAHHDVTGGDAPNREECEGFSTVEPVGGTFEAAASIALDDEPGDDQVVHEGPSAIVHRIRLDDGRTIAAKSLIGEPEPSVDDVCRLNNEYNILTGPLAKCTSGVRKVLGRSSINGSCDQLELGPESKLLLERYGKNTVFFEWAEGISLAEWIGQFSSRLKRDRHNGSRNENALLEEIVRLMHCIASALANVHEAGVLHNDIEAESFIIQPDGAEARIIGFGYATPRSMQEVDDEGENVNDDIFCLGAIYRDLLRAGLKAHRKSFKGRKGAVERSSLTSMARTSITHLAREDFALDGAPPCLSALISKLIKSDHDLREANDVRYLPEPQYTSATEIAEVLSRMLGDPGAFLYTQNAGNKPSINLESSMLYGRAEEIKTLLDTCQELSSGNPGVVVRPRMVVVKGAGGAGKSALLKKLGSFVDQTEKGIFAYGKYNQLQRSKPYSALVGALDSLCETILLRGESARKQLKRDIELAVGSEIGVLTQLIPGLPRILAGEEGKPVVKGITSLRGIEAQNRFKFVFLMFARALASPDRPIVLALDDLQWADEASLYLIRSIMMDKGNSSPLLVVVSYRHDEVREDRLLVDTIMAVDRKTEIEVGNLSFDELNTMVSDALHIPRLVTCKTLTSVILRKTFGNVFFARQFLQSILDDNLLLFDAKQLRWACDMEAISSLSMTDNVLILLTNKIRDRLSGPAREVLELAACLGSVFDMTTLQLLFFALPSTAAPTGQPTEEELAGESKKYHDLNQRLDMLVKEGLIVKEEGTFGVRYKFSHDRIQQAAYSTVPEERRAALHLRIGELIWKSLNDQRPKWESPSQSSEYLFLAIDQMNKGSSEIADKASKVAHAELNLKAGQICIEKSAFQQAASYLKMGISSIDVESYFEEDYLLSLKLHDLAIEAEYCNGRLDEVSLLAERVLTNAKSFDDKLHTYETLILAKGIQGKMREAIETGLEVLDMLGESFPRKEPIPKKAVMFEMARSKMILKSKSDDQLLSLPPMVDRKKIAAMQIICTVLLYAYWCRKDLVPFFVLRLIRLSLRYGVCDATVVGFSSFGMILSGALGDVRGGFRFGQLALAFLERSAAKNYVAKVNLTIHFTINHWVVPLSESIQPLLHSSRVGMEAGDILHATTCSVISLTCAFYAGEPLNEIEENAKNLCHQMVEYSSKQVTLMHLHCKVLLLWQMVRKLLGKSENPVLLTGQANDSISREVARTKNDPTLENLYSSYLAYIFGDYERAAEMAEAASDAKKTKIGSFHVCAQAYIEALSALALVRSTKKRKWKSVARRAFRKIKKWSVNSPNLLHKRLLLEAEFAALNGKKSKVMQIYDAAVIEAGKIGCTQDEALSYERAGVFLSQKGDACGASQYFVRAHQCYLKWGAQHKADHLYSQQMISSG